MIQFFFLGIFIVVLLLYIGLVQILWNSVVPDIFNGMPLTFGQTALLVILVAFLAPHPVFLGKRRQSRVRRPKTRYRRTVNCVDVDDDQNDGVKRRVCTLSM